MKTLVITCPSAATDQNLRKLEHYYGIEFERGASNGGGENGYHRMIGDEQLLNNLYFHNLIKNGFVKDAKVSSYLNQINWNKGESGGNVSLSGSDGSDVMQIFPKLYAILGGTNPSYERYIFSNEFFSYDGDDAIEIKSFADAPDYVTIFNNTARSIYNEGVAGTQGNTQLTNFSFAGNDYQTANGYPKCSLSRYYYETYARNKNADRNANIPYANASTLDLEVIMALMFIECRTKNLNSVFGHAISSNVTPSAANWGTVSGFKFTKEGDDTIPVFKKFSDSVYVNGVSTNVWSILNNQSPLLKIFEAQRAISNGDTLETVYNSDGIPLQNKANGVMTGIWTKTFTAKLNCSMSSSEAVSSYNVEIVLRVPVWRGRTRLWGNIWSHLSGYEVLHYKDTNDVIHNILFRAPSIEQMTTDNDEVVKTNRNDFTFVNTYEEICDLGSVSGWMKNSISNANGVTLATAKDVGGAINNYESAYTYLNSGANTEVGKYIRKTAGFFGGSAYASSVVLRYCYAYYAPSNASPSIGSGCRAALE